MFRVVPGTESFKGLLWRRGNTCKANVGVEKHMPTRKHKAREMKRTIEKSISPEEFHTNPSHCSQLSLLPHCEHLQRPAFDWRHQDLGTEIVPWWEISWHLQNHVLQSLLLELPLPCCTPSGGHKMAATNCRLLKDSNSVNPSMDLEFQAHTWMREKKPQKKQCWESTAATTVMPVQEWQTIVSLTLWVQTRFSISSSSSKDYKSNTCWGLRKNKHVKRMWPTRTSEALLRSQQNAYSWTSLSSFFPSHGLVFWPSCVATASAVKGASPSLFLPSLVQFHYKHHLLNSMQQNVIKLQRRTRRQNPNIAQTSSFSFSSSSSSVQTTRAYFPR